MKHEGKRLEIFKIGNINESEYTDYIAVIEKLVAELEGDTKHAIRLHL
ncbi:hypothetical protein [Paenibacillus sp. yr247]|nr:hypothetical protein [Paenibacillus sp. yr247]